MRGALASPRLSMTVRGYAPLSALLAVSFFCLMPALLGARPRERDRGGETHRASARVWSSRSGSRLAHDRSERGGLSGHNGLSASSNASNRHRRSARAAGYRTNGYPTARMVRSVSLRRSGLRRSGLRENAGSRSPRVTRVDEPGRIVPGGLETVVRHASEAGATGSGATGSGATGVSHPPDLDDVDPSDPSEAAPVSATAPVPVISVIRKTAEKPQLPPIEEVAATPEILPSLYNKRGRLIVPPALRGSREILLHQNEIADREGLDRVQDDGDLETMRHRYMLVALPVSGGMQVDERLPYNRRYCRPWTAQFLAALARAHYARFHTPLQINSAVRTVEFQQRLLRTNGNAAPAGGETASPHLTGQAVDLAKHGLSLSEIAWMRGYLLPLIEEGKIDVEEEFQQSCFHISVYKKYLSPALVPPRSIASTHRDRPAALALAIH